VVRKNRVRCSNQKLQDPLGVLRPEFIHVTSYGVPRILLIVKSDGVFGTHKSALFRTTRAATSFFDHSTYIKDAGNLPWQKDLPRLIYLRRALSNEFLLTAVTGTGFFTIGALRQF